MIVRHTTCRRFLALIAGTLIAMAAVVAVRAPAQAQPLEDREIVAVVGLDDQLWVSDSGGAQWRSLGGRLIDAPSVVRVAFDLYFLGLGTDHNVWIRTLDQGWRPFGPDGTHCTGPGAGWVSVDVLAVACRGADGAAWLTQVEVPIDPGVVPTARDPRYGGWRSLGGVIKYGTAVTTYPPDPQEEPDRAVVAVGADDRPWFHVEGAGWRRFSDETCGGPLAASVRPFAVLACAAPDGQLRVFHPGSGSAARDLGGRITGRPGIAASFFDRQVDYFALGTDGGVWLTRERATGGQDPWARLPGAGRHGLSAEAPRS